MSVMTALAGWLKGEKDLAAELGLRRDELIDHDGRRPAGIDVAAHREWLKARGEIELSIQATEDALAVARTKAAEAKAAAEAEQGDRDHKEAEKLAIAHGKLAVEIASEAEKLAKKLAKLEEMRATIDAANAKRGQRPFIFDGEQKVRSTPSKTIPAVYEERDAWVRPSDGARPMVFMTNRDGEIVPREAGFQKIRERVCVQPERFIPAEMPERFATSVTLVDLQGRQIWPVR